jgi:ubiquinol-cytochrome c reductase cytochrome b subunit
MLNLLNKIYFNLKRLLLLNVKRSNNNFLFAFVSNHLIYYPTPVSLTYAWSFGFLAGMCLLTQMISGIFLAMHYTPHIDLAFSSVEYIMRDVPNG